MESSQEELISLIDKCRGTKMLVVGDVVLDRYIWGNVDRISPEAPVPVVHVRRTEDRLGCAGLVVRNLRGMGADVRLHGIIGDDEEGHAIVRLLEQEGVSSDGLLVAKDRPTTVKTRVIAHAQQVVRIDREEVENYSEKLSHKLAQSVEEKIGAVAGMVVSDYGKGTISYEVVRMLAAAQEAGRLGIGRCPVIVDPHPVNYAIYAGMTAAKPNRKEAELATGIRIRDKESALRAGQELLKRWRSDMMLISLGEDGLMVAVAGQEEGYFLPTVARQVFDVSGAGDTVTSIFSLALAVGASPKLAGDLANIAAGVVVGEVGTVGITTEVLRAEVERLAVEKSARKIKQRE